MLKVAIIYLRIVRRVDPTLPLPFSYETGHRRFIESYKQFKPEYPHHLLVVDCGAEGPRSDFDEIAFCRLRYDGYGSDCGSYQAVATSLDYDLIICMNTLAYLWRARWLENFVFAASEYPRGVYGATASLESNPHLRTPCIGFHPEVLRQYPREVNCRQDAVEFESGPENFSIWAHRQGCPSLLVTPEGALPLKRWREGRNLFRRGDQSSCLVWDRHTLLYSQASPKQKQALSRAADGR